MMIIKLVACVIILLVLCYLFFTKNKKSKNRSDTEIDQINGIEDKFFEGVNNGKEKIQFLKIDNQMDLVFIKSLFQAENIPCYVEFETVSRVRPSINLGDLGNYTLLYILEEDYDDALKVVEDYLESRENGDIDIEIYKKT